MRSVVAAAFLACAATLFFSPAAAQPPADSSSLAQKLLSADLEDLMEIEVSIASKKSKQVSDTAAAVFVITQEDLRRSGATSIPEALRLVPGFQVARIDSSRWAISSRGFNSVFANKLLVLIDGRNVYTPLFGGVYWNVQDVVLEDVEQIEVIRGPGSSVWGSNAVNGVINIITKHASETQGSLVSAGGGNEELFRGTVRHGGELSETTWYRVYAKHKELSDSKLAQESGDSEDRWNLGAVGFRLDSQPERQRDLRLQGDLYLGREDTTVRVPTFTPPFIDEMSSESDLSGGNLMFSWTERLHDESAFYAKIYHDWSRREGLLLDNRQHAFNAEIGHSFTAGKRHALNWGLEYRFVDDESDGSPSVSLGDREDRQTNLFSLFLQDEIALLRDALFFTVGSRIEHNSYTDVEVEPTARLLWKADEKNSFWTAFTRSTRVPTRAEDDLRLSSSVFPNPDGTLSEIEVRGRSSVPAETVYSYELGYRHSRESFLADLTAFTNHIDDYRTFERGTPFAELQPIPHTVVPFIASDLGSADVYGAELYLEYQATRDLRLSGSYTYLDIHFYADPSSTDPMAPLTESESPVHQFYLQSRLDLPWNLEQDLMIRWVDEIPAYDIDSYWELDARLGWRPDPAWEFAIIGRNLLDSSHAEYQSDFVSLPPSEIERSVFAVVTWRN